MDSNSVLILWPLSASLLFVDSSIYTGREKESFKVSKRVMEG